MPTPHAWRILLVLVPVVAGLIILLPLVFSDQEDEGHYARGETEVVVVDLGGSLFSVVKVGNTPSDTAVLAGFDPAGTWLAKGNYYVVASSGGLPVYYGIPLTGYRSGPDDGGRFTVTLRPPPREYPPVASPHGIQCAHIPSGSFLLGDRLNPREWHAVWLTGFFVAPFEVTNAEFARFVAAPDGYADNVNWTEDGWRWKSDNPLRSSSLLKKTDPDYVRFGQPDQPVTLVSWYEANAYCRWLTRTVGDRRWQFTLPTEAEWEKAARGPENFDYALGMTLSDAESKLYNWRKNPIATEPVFGISATRERFIPNRFGLYHMTGNVAEWVQSAYLPYDRRKPYADDERNHDNGVVRRSARGGSWYSATSASLSIPYRDAFQPGHRTQELGFRVFARMLP